MMRSKLRFSQDHAAKDLVREVLRHFSGPPGSDNECTLNGFSPEILMSLAELVLEPQLLKGNNPRAQLHRGRFAGAFVISPRTFAEILMRITGCLQKKNEVWKALRLCERISFPDIKGRMVTKHIDDASAAEIDRHIKWKTTTLVNGKRTSIYGTNPVAIARYRQRLARRDQEDASA